MKEIMLKPSVFTFDTAKEFAEEFGIGKGDLVISNEYIYMPFFGELNLECEVLYQEKYGMGEPTDQMVEAIYADIKSDPKRIIAIGGGTIIDICKLFALKDVSPVDDLYDGKIPPVKDKELVLVPTTCGTGSEVTNVAVLALVERGTKKGLAVDQMYADTAVLVPELLGGLPFKVFATSSIDALIHAIESALSPNGSPTTRMFSYKAIEMIVRGYMEIAKNGPDARKPLLKDVLVASNYAGIAFGNAGCAAVHAMSYPIGATFHVAHGESNYAMFPGVMKNYLEIKTDGEIAVMCDFLAGILGCDAANAFDELCTLLDTAILKRKPLSEYGMTEAQIAEFADSVIENQQRLLKNNFVFLDRDRLMKIYSDLFSE